ncbi:MAG: PAS domain S-box protein, partial [Chitinivibrionales bacterium]
GMDIKNKSTVLGEDIKYSYLEDNPGLCRKIFRYAGEGMLVLGSDLTIMLANEAAANILGSNNTPLEGKKLCSLGFSDEKGIREKHSELLNNPYCYFNTEFHLQSGHLITLAFSSAVIDSEEGIILDTIRDISEEKNIEKALKESEERYRNIINTSSNLIFRCDRDMKFTYINDAWENILGYTKKEIIWKRFSSFQRRESAEKFKNEYIDTGKIKIKGFETMLIAKSGARISILMNAIKIFTGSGEFRGIQGNAYDITARKNAEEERLKLEKEIHQKQKMETIGQLVGGIAHDYNNNLSAILGYAELLKSKVSNNNQLANYANRIIQSANHSSSLTDKLVAYARKGMYHNQEIELNTVLANSIEKFYNKNQNHASVIETSDNSELYIKGDQLQIETMIINVLQNAGESFFSSDESINREIRINSKKIYLNKEFTSKRQYYINEGEYSYLSITDNGSGMDNDTKERMFEPFFSKDKGENHAGMGMAATYGIVKNHGGIIEVKSRWGNGTCVEIYLPLLKSKEGTKKETKTIIILDDDIITLETLNDILLSLGYNVIKFTDSSECVDYYKRHHASIDLAIIDVVLPATNGIEVFSELKEISQENRTILTSGYTYIPEPEINNCRQFCGFIKKPFNIESLSSKIADVFA